jgi:hypothetical protein
MNFRLVLKSKWEFSHQRRNAVHVAMKGHRKFRKFLYGGEHRKKNLCRKCAQLRPWVLFWRQCTTNSMDGNVIQLLIQKPGQIYMEHKQVNNTRMTIIFLETILNLW